MISEEKRSNYYNFFIGNDPAQWRSQVAAYTSLLYRNLYPGIDVRVREEEAGRLEYDLLLAPGANLKSAIVRASGAQKIEVADDGALLVHTANGTLRQSPPVTWEVLPNGERQFVECRFTKIDASRYGFVAARRDTSLPLVVDPGLDWSTFLGGGGDERVERIIATRDGTGDVIIIGSTLSADFPAMSGGWNAIGQAIYLTRINATGSALVYSTLFGGSSVNIPMGLALDASGAPVIVGGTASNDFPVTSGAYDTTYNGQDDAFVTRFNQTGSSIVFSTYLGGSHINPAFASGGTDQAWGVGFDPTGSIIVAGYTTSLDFPVMPGAYDTTPNTYTDATYSSMQDAFISRLDATGARLTYSTYLGAQGVDTVADLEIDGQGVVTLAGTTTPLSRVTSTATMFRSARRFNNLAPTTGRSTGSQSYISRLKLDGAGTADLKYSTLLGGNDTDEATALAVNPNNPESFVIVGKTFSGDFPTTPGVIERTHSAPGEVTNMFVTRFQFPIAGGGSLVWSSYFNGPGPSFSRAEDVARRHWRADRRRSKQFT
ncbi:MAG: hypothetical protein WKF30_00160 [Pyrinomonadaceae bacterium]